MSFQKDPTIVFAHSISGSEKLFSTFKELFPPDKFLLYNVNREQLLSKRLFQVLAIDFGDGNDIDDEILDIIKQLINEKKQVLLISGNLKLDSFGDVFLEQKTIDHLNDNIYVIKSGDGTHLVHYQNEKYFLENHEKVSELLDLSKYLVVQDKFYHTSVFVFAKTENEIPEFLKSVKIGENFQYGSLDFVSHQSVNPEAYSPKIHKLLKFVNNKDFDDFHEILSFKSQDYFPSLNTENLGKIVLYSDVLLSSYTLMEKFVELGNHHSINIISRTQTGGRGAGTNKWVSPIGCALFTFLIHIPKESKLSQSKNFMLYIMAESVLQTINSACEFEKGALKIKWPNDIHWDGHGKLSGILIKPVEYEDNTHFIIGCGINVFNKEPTVCLNDIIEENNKISGNNKKCPSTETIIGQCLTTLETSVSKIQSSENGIENFMNEYYKHWTHQDKHVTVEKEGQSLTGQIIGINDSGFLQVKQDVQSGDDQQIIELDPYHSSYDVEKNCISEKL